MKKIICVVALLIGALVTTGLAQIARPGEIIKREPVHYNDKPATLLPATKTMVVGKWGKCLPFFYDIKYFDIAFKANGRFTVVGKAYAKDFLMIGSYKIKNGWLNYQYERIVKGPKDAVDFSKGPVTREAVIIRDNIGLRLVTMNLALGYDDFYKGIHWDFKRKGYYDAKGRKKDIKL